MTLEFGECLAPFEVFQPFIATSEMLVLVAAPPKKGAQCGNFAYWLRFGLGFASSTNVDV